MKRIFALLIIGMTVSCGQQKNENIAEAEQASDLAEFVYYGESINPDGATTIESLDLDLTEGDTVNIKVEGTIDATCAMKGCWMTLKTDEGDVRVTFRDYGFFVPTEGQSGKTAVIEGVAVKTTTDVATLKHYAQDAGKSKEEIDAITEPEEGIALIATGVAIK